MPTPPDPVQAAFYGRLHGDETLLGLLASEDGIFERRAPSGSTPPYLVYNRQAGTSIWTFRESTEEALWLFKGVCRGLSSKQAKAIDTRAQELLHRTKLALTGGMLTILRESAVDYGEESAGETWHHVGSIYRVFHT